MLPLLPRPHSNARWISSSERLDWDTALAYFGGGFAHASEHPSLFRWLVDHAKANREAAVEALETLLP